MIGKLFSTDFREAEFESILTISKHLHSKLSTLIRGRFHRSAVFRMRTGKNVPHAPAFHVK